MSVEDAHSRRDPGKEGGTIVRGADGALYFLRDSLLEQARLPRDLAVQAERLVSDPEQDTENFRLAEPETLEPVARVDGRVGATGQGFRANMAAMSTVMCPSFLFRPGGEVMRERE